MTKMFVIKRNGRKQPVMFDKITARIQKLCYGLNPDNIDSHVVTKEVIGGVYSGITTVELDNIAAEIAIMKSCEDPDYAILAARLAVSNLHKETQKCFTDVCQLLRNNKNTKSGIKKPLISQEYFQNAMNNADQLNSAIIHDRDYNYSYFGFKALEEKVLNKINGKVVERPQQMLMRVALAMHGEDINAVIKSYNLMSAKYYIPDFVTLYNAGFPERQIARSFSLNMRSDSIEGICDSLEDCGTITKYGGEVGFTVNCIRATGAFIAGTNGTSNGLVPMLRVFNDMAAFVHQNNQPGVIAKLRIYIEPWHADIMDVISLKLTNLKEEDRARDLCYALWVPDLFMKRVEDDGDWYLMCPKECDGLRQSYGDRFEELYASYVKDGIYRKKVKARTLWMSILESQRETGGPSILFKDTCNRKSNHQNIGTLTGSNYSAECMTYSSPDENPAVVSASISLNRFITKDKQFDFEKLKEITKMVTQDLDNLIDSNKYMNYKMKNITQQLRPISISVQGLADTFIRLRLPFESDEAQALNVKIFETIYFASLAASCDLAKEKGKYEGYDDSPISKGILQYDMWNSTPTELQDWKLLKERLSQYGVRNSLLVGLGPTAFQSEVFASTESCEPLHANTTCRKLSSGNYQEINEHILRDLTELGLWNKDLQNELVKNKGSIQQIKGIPEELKNLYKTKWEVSQKVVIKMAVDRAPYIDQSQSLNIYMASPNYGKLNSMNFYTWTNGLKTGLHCVYTKNV